MIAPQTDGRKLVKTYNWGLADVKYVSLETLRFTLPRKFVHSNTKYWFCRGFWPTGIPIHFNMIMPFILNFYRMSIVIMINSDHFLHFSFIHTSFFWLNKCFNFFSLRKLMNEKRFPRLIKWPPHLWISTFYFGRGGDYKAMI